jgi:amino acid transporter
MQSLAEMGTYIPVSGAFTAYASRFVDQSLGFSMGWIYWFSWAITFALELTATGLIIQYWDQSINIAIFISIFFVVITALNLMPVKMYGEIEFYFALIKVITIIGFLLFAFCIDMGAGQQGFRGAKTWNNPGAFAPYQAEQINNEALAKFISFWAVMIKAGFSYQGTELVGIAAGETENPRKNVPAAVKKTFYRIVFFFVFTVFFCGLLIPYDDPDLLSSSSDATASPFVIAARLAGVKILPDIINGVLLTVVLSAANSNVYSGSRILVGLAEEGSAPQILKRTTNNGVPYVAVLATASVGLLAFINLSATGGTVFNWFLNITGVAGFISWACISISHIRFMAALRAQGIDRNTLPFKAIWQPWFAWFGLVFNVLIVITQGFTAFLPWNVTDFFVDYISLILFVLLYAGHKIWTKSSYVRSVDADLLTGNLASDETVWNDDKPKTLLGKLGTWFL